MQKTLFERLGGRSGISMLVDDTVDAHMKNPAVNARFLPFLKQPERLAQIKQHTVDFFSAGSGGPAQYSGKDMVTTHTGMNISPGEYMHVIDDIFIAHIAGMDAFARALESAAAILEESPYKEMRKERYSSFDSDKGKSFENGDMSLEDLREYAISLGKEPEQNSGKQELYEAIVNMYI